MDNDIRIFTESSEDIGLLYNGYKNLDKEITKFLNVIESAVTLVRKNPKASIDIKDNIDAFKAVATKKFEPDPITINRINQDREKIKRFKAGLNEILTRYSKIRDKMAFGGNFFRSILNKPKVYSREIDPNSYETTNANIRSIDRALDWVEKLLIDLFNLADQDLNMLTIVGRVYAKKKIYEKVSDESYNIDNELMEASHGKLKYDFRMGWDYNTGHMIKVVYSLDNIEITDVGNFYYDYDGRKVGATHDSHLRYARDTIKKKGNTDHQSTGQKVLAIIDTVTNTRLQEVKLLNPFCSHIKSRAMSQPKEALEKARAAADSNPSFLTHVKVGEVDNSKTYKSTHWASRVIDKDSGQNLRFNKIAKSEMLRDGRGWKVNNIDAKDFPIYGDPNKYMIYHNPNKQQALQELFMREEDILNYLKAHKGDPEFKNSNSYKASVHNLRIIQRDIDRVESGPYDLSIMKKYRESDDGRLSGLTGMQLLEYDTYMDFRPSNSMVKRSSAIDVLYGIQQCYSEGGSNMDDDDDLSWVTNYLMEDVDAEDEPPSMPENVNEQPKEVEKESMPKKTDKAESSKNGVRRKKLYIAFIEWCKEYNPKNTFGSIFDKDAFNVSYPFIPEEMRYFYRLANPMLCVLAGELTFFAASELRKLNSKNSHLNELVIFAATPTDVRVFNVKDKKVYRGIEENGAIKLNEILGNTFDIYIQKMINKGDILNAPLEESADFFE